MKNLRSVFALYLGGLLLLAACRGGGSSSALVQIPADAGMVISINLKSLSSKTKDIQELFDKQMLEAADIDSKEIQEMAEKLVKSGVDFNEKMIFYAKFAKGEENVQGGVAFMLKDPAAFEKALAESKEKFEVKKDGDIRYAQKRNGFIGWKGKQALALFKGSGAANVNFLEVFKKQVALKAPESLTAKNKEYQDLEKTSPDFGLWYDSQQVLKIMDDKTTQELKKESKILDEIYRLTTCATMSVNFENGQIVTESVSHFNKDLAKRYQDVVKEGIHQKVLKAIPINDPTIMFGLGLGMKRLYELVKYEKGMSDFEKQAKELGFKSAQELFETFSGDFAVITDQLKLLEVYSSGGRTLPEMVIAVGINNKAGIEKMLKVAKAAGAIDDRGDFYKVKMGNRGEDEDEAEGFLIVKNDAAYFTTSTKHKDAIIAGKGSLDSKMLDKTKGNCSMMYVNLKAIISQVPAEVMGLLDSSEEGKALKKYVLDELQDIESDASTIKNDRITGKAIVRFRTKDKNALAIISTMVKEMQKASKKKQMSMR